MNDWLSNKGSGDVATKRTVNVVFGLDAQAIASGA